MPVTKTAKRALRSSKRKELVNKHIISQLDYTIRKAKKSATESNIKNVYSMADRAAKKKVIHKNKAARIKSQASKLISKKKTAPKKTSKQRESS